MEEEKAHIYSDHSPSGNPNDRFTEELMISLRNIWSNIDNGGNSSNSTTTTTTCNSLPETLGVPALSSSSDLRGSPMDPVNNQNSNQQLNTDFANPSRRHPLSINPNSFEASIWTEVPINEGNHVGEISFVGSSYQSVLRNDSVGLDSVLERSGGLDMGINYLLYNNLGPLKTTRLFCNDPNLLEQLQDYVIAAMAKDRKGSQYLQSFLIKRDHRSTSKIVNGVLNSLVELMTDQHGNYLFQRLLQHCDPNQLERIVIQITSQEDALVNASLHRIGTRSVQTLIRTVKKLKLIAEVVKALSISDGFYKLMIDPVGKHVIDHCLTHLNSKTNKPLYEVAINRFLELATHKQGCVSLKSCITCIIDPHRSMLLDKISLHAVFLAQNPFGNYVIQEAIELENPELTEEICLQLRGRYIRLSVQKSGSHVVEKCMKSRCTNAGISYLVEEFKASNQLGQVAQDQFGNYVIQKALILTKSRRLEYLYQSLVTAIIPHLQDLEFHMFGQNVFRLIENEAAVIQALH